MRAPLVASPFLQSDGMKAARLGRKNGAATSTLPSPVGSLVAVARFPHPCAVTSLAAGVRIVHARFSRASAAPAPPGCTRRSVQSTKGGPFLELDSLDARYPEIYAELERLRLRLEAHYKRPCEIDFCIENGRLFILGVKPARMRSEAHARAALELLAEGLISPDDAIRQIPLDLLEHTLAPRILSFDDLTLLARGLPVSAGSAAGVAVFDGPAAHRFAEDGRNPIVIVVEFYPSLFPALLASAGLLTTRGGSTSHGAVAARACRRPCVVGAAAIRIDHENSRAFVDGQVIETGDPITIDGSAGNIYRGTPPIESSYWWDDHLSSRVAALVENVLRVGSDDDDVVAKCWRFRDAFAHNDLGGFGLSRAHRRAGVIDFTDVPSDIARMHAALHGWHYSSADTICLTLSWLIDGLGRILSQRAGLGQHPRYFRPLWDPLATKSETVQMVGFEYFSINALVPFWIDIATIKFVFEVTLEEGRPPWELDRTNLRGASLSAGSRDVLGWAVWINDAQVSPQDIVTVSHFIRSREFGWKWFDANDVTYDQLRKLLSAGLHPRSRHFRLYQKCVQLGLVQNDKLSAVGESFVTEPHDETVDVHTTNELVERATDRIDELITAAIQRGYGTRTNVLDDYGELIRRREFREAIITDLYETRFSPDRHEFDYALVRELVESIASIPAVAYVAGAVTAGVVGNAAYDVIKRIASAIAERFDQHDKNRADLWRAVADDAERIETYFKQHSLATAEEISAATGIQRDKLVPLLKLLGFTYDRGKGRNGWTQGPKRLAIPDHTCPKQL